MLGGWWVECFSIDFFYTISTLLIGLYRPFPVNLPKISKLQSSYILMEFCKKKNHCEIIEIRLYGDLLKVEHRFFIFHGNCMPNPWILAKSAPLNLANS